MKTISARLVVVLTLLVTSLAHSQKPGEKYNNADYKLKSAAVVYEERIDALVFEITVEGQAGKTTPTPGTKLSHCPKRHPACRYILIRPASM